MKLRVRCRHEKDSDKATPATEVVNEGEMREAEIDDNLKASFPASDPPAWTLGVDPHSDIKQQSESDDRDD